MAKLRLYEGTSEAQAGAQYTLYHVLLTVLKLFAPILPYVTEEIYRRLFTAESASVHTLCWPAPDESLEDDWSESVGERLIEIATAVRRYKTEHGLALGSKIERLQVTAQNAALAQALRASVSDIMSITRADKVEISEQAGTSSLVIQIEGASAVALEQTRR
jgi:valyl-tRNA synthetase